MHIHIEISRDVVRILRIRQLGIRRHRKSGIRRFRQGHDHRAINTFRAFVDMGGSRIDA